MSLADVRGIADLTKAERRRLSPASRILADVERTNARLGHENLGPLSPTTGFLLAIRRCSRSRRGTRPGTGWPRSFRSSTGV